MRMYPRYSFKETIEEYAIVFFTLLEEGYKALYAEYQMQASIMLLPYSSKESRLKFLNSLEWAAKGTDDTIKPVDNAAAYDQLRKLFGGK